MDRFQVNGERLYKIYMGFLDANGKLEPWDHASYPLGQAAKEQIPEVEEVVAIAMDYDVLLYREGRSFKGRGMDASMNLFDWMSFPLVQGSFDREKAGVDQLAISQSMAERLFGVNWERTALGNPVQLGKDGKEIPVVAIFADIPVHSSLQFDFVTNLERQPLAELAGNWGNHSYETYLLINEPASVETVRQKVQEIYFKSGAADEGESILMQPLHDQYLYSRFDETGRASGGRIDYVRIFSFAALFLLLIACVNFVNLTTARASRRAKEVGVRKVVGAARATLVRQFLTESGLITALSIGLALLLVSLLLPPVRALTGRSMIPDLQAPIFWIAIGGLIVFTTVFAGIYPAILLSSFRVKNILQGNFFSQGGHQQVRRALVILQFVLSFVLIVGALVIQRQIHYIKNAHLGLDRDNILQLDLNDLATEKYDIIRADLLRSPGVAGLTRTSGNPLDIQIHTNGVDWPGKTDREGTIHFDFLWAEDNFPELFGSELTNGRFYQTGMGADSNGVVVNETAVRIMGLEEPLGKRIQVFGQDRQIIGVIQDFHSTSFYRQIPPLVINRLENWNRVLSVRTEAGQTTEAIASLAKVLEKVAPGSTLEYRFLDEQYARLYQSESLMGTLANWFALFSIVISCLGMLGLVTFSAEHRAKEIGIRRVLGASVFQVVQLLSRDFMVLVLLAGILALPLSYHFSRQWLDQFVYHQSFSAWVFVLAFVLMVGLSLITVGIQGYKAGVVNPVERLRGE